MAVEAINLTPFWTLVHSVLQCAIATNKTFSSDSFQSASTQPAGLQVQLLSWRRWQGNDGNGCNCTSLVEKLVQRMIWKGHATNSSAYLYFNKRDIITTDLLA